MKSESLIRFYRQNSIDDVKEYQNRIIENIKETTRLEIRYFFYMVLLIFIYYLMQISSLTSINIGFVDITNLKVVKIIVPPIFAAVFLMLYGVQFRKEQLVYQAKTLFNLIYKTNSDPKDVENNKFDDFHISFLPFDIHDELFKSITTAKFWDYVGILTIVSFYLILGSLIYVFEFLIVKQLFYMWNDGFIVRFITIVTCFLIFLSFFFMIKLIVLKYDESEENKNFWKVFEKSEIGTDQNESNITYSDKTRSEI